ncbi:MAG: glycosyltransferase family 2 protein [Erysipelotrichaceae bacterium]
MKPKISIVVPTYNVEAYIAKCLDSLVQQDYENYDVLVVNDGSPANEQVIIDQYAKQYPTIIKSIVKENGGYGSVLSLAFSTSDAEYVLVCDPDDYLDQSALSTLYAYMSEHDAELVVGAKNLVYSDNDEIKYDASFNANFTHLKDHHLYHKQDKDFEALYFLEPSPHSKLYKRSIVAQIQFPQKVSYTDNLLFFYTLAKVEKVVYCEQALSYYLIDRAGNTRTDLNPKIIDAWVKVFTNIMSQVTDAQDIFYYRMFESFYSIFYKVDTIKGNDTEKIEKYQLIYQFLEMLILHKEAILNKNKDYQKENTVILNQKEKLLTRETSRKMYDTLVMNRLNRSLKQRVKSKVMNHESLSKLYDIYHFHAKYHNTKNDEKMILHPQVICESLNHEDVNFFGYYDKPCIAYGHSLTHRVNSTKLELNQEIDILVDKEKVSSSKSWNWQQGAMSSWLDENHIIHNDFSGTHYISKIVNIDTKEVKIIDFPIYSLAKNKTFALSLNFNRLAQLRADYGYFNQKETLNSLDTDGIYYVDLNNNTHSLWLSLREISSFEPEETMKKAIHKVNHIDVSPNSDRAIFLHRWYLNDVKYTRLMMVDISTKTMHVMASNGMVSHMTWVDNDCLFGYLKGNNQFNGYFFIDMDKTQTMITHPLLVDDGHPTVYNRRYIVTDAYPDYTCKSKLMLIDTFSNEVTLLGQFYSGKAYQNTKRCDLHPRFNKEGKGITFDSVCSGKREVYQMNLELLIKES